MSEEPEIETTLTEETSAESKYRRLTPAQWEQVVVLWELGKVTLAELNKMFGISIVALRKGLKNRGAIRGVRAHEVGTSAVEAAKSDAQKNVERISAMKERFLSYSDIVAKLTMKEITEAARDKVPLGTKRNDLQTLQRAANILQTLRGENYHLLGLFDENALTEELPEIGITEYTAEEIAKIQRGFDTVEDTFEEFDLADGDLHLPFGDEGEED